MTIDSLVSLAHQVIRWHERITREGGTHGNYPHPETESLARAVIEMLSASDTCGYTVDVVRDEHGVAVMMVDDRLTPDATQSLAVTLLHGLDAARSLEARGTVECGSCRGYGHFSKHGKPSGDRRDRKCLDCGGEGQVPNG